MVSQLHEIPLLCEVKICANDNMLVCKRCDSNSFTALMCILAKLVSVYL